jgi:hypothetical protein
VDAAGDKAVAEGDKEVAQEVAEEVASPKRPCPASEATNKPKRRRVHTHARCAVPKRTIMTRSQRAAANKGQRTCDI